MFSDSFHVLLFQILEEKIITFVKNELKALKEDLWPESSQAAKNRRREDEVLDGKEAGQRHADKDDFLKITLSFLRQMKQDQLADYLQRSKFLFCIQGAHHKYTSVALILATRETKVILQGCG